MSSPHINPATGLDERRLEPPPVQTSVQRVEWGVRYTRDNKVMVVQVSTDRSHVEGWAAAIEPEHASDVRVISREVTTTTTWGEWEDG